MEFKNNNEKVFNSEKRFEQSQQPQAEKKGLGKKFKEQSTGKKWIIGTLATAAVIGAGYGIVKGVKYAYKKLTKKGEVEEVVEEEKTNKEQPKEEKK